MLASIYALRAQVEALAMAAEEEMGISSEPPLEPGSCPACKTGPDATAKIASFGDEAGKRRCTACGHEWMPIGSGAGVTQDGSTPERMRG